MSIKNEAVKGTTENGGQSAEKQNGGLVAHLQALDAERWTLVESTVARLTAGNIADKDAYRRIKAIDAQRNRLLVARFSALLREGSPKVKPLIEQLLKV